MLEQIKSKTVLMAFESYHAGQYRNQRGEGLVGVSFR